MSIITDMRRIIIETEKLLKYFSANTELDYVQREILKQYKMKLQNILKNYDQKEKK